MSAYYDIDFASLVNYLLPVRLRKSVLTRWLCCLIQPVMELYGYFYQNRTSTLYTLSHNSQVVYLQAALNDTFDPDSRGVYITDGAIDDPLFIYTQPENKPLWLGLESETGTTPYPDPQPLYTASEISITGNQFIVLVPGYIVFNEARMRALVDKYRLPSKNTYTLEIY